MEEDLMNFEWLEYTLNPKTLEAGLCYLKDLKEKGMDSIPVPDFYIYNRPLNVLVIDGNMEEAETVRQDLLNGNLKLKKENGI